MNPTMKIAFSTIACPTWTLEQVASKAAAFGYLGVELRSFDDRSVKIASEPFGLEPAAIESIFDDAGVKPMALATSIRYDKAIDPPVMGRMCQDEEEGVSDTKAYVDLADRAGIEFVRVFGNHLPAAEPRTWSMRRVSDRLKLAAQTARNTKVRVLIENAGSFSTTEPLLELVNIVDSPWLEVSFNALAAHQGGQCPVEAIGHLGDRLEVVKVCDLDHDGNPVKLGQGIMPIREMIEALGAMNYAGWVVYEYPKLWQVNDDGLDSDEMLRHGADMLYQWMAALPAGC